MAVPTPQSGTEDMKYFDFFGLPRELRDRILSEVGGHEATVTLPDDPPAWTADEAIVRLPRWDKYQLVMTLPNTPRTSMLLVSKQVKLEYEEELLRHAALRIHTRRLSPTIKAGVQQWSGNLFDYVEHVRRAELATWRGIRDDEKKFSEIYELHVDVMKTLLPYFRDLKSLQTEWHINMEIFDFNFGNKCDWEELFVDLASFRLDGNEHTVQIKPRLFFYGPVFSTWDEYQPTDEDYARYSDLREFGWQDLSG